jgi:hypothetical protein
MRVLYPSRTPWLSQPLRAPVALNVTFKGAGGSSPRCGHRRTGMCSPPYARAGVAVVPVCPTPAGGTLMLPGEKTPQPRGRPGGEGGGGRRICWPAAGSRDPAGVSARTCILPPLAGPVPDTGATSGRRAAGAQTPAVSPRGRPTQLRETSPRGHALMPRSGRLLWKLCSGLLLSWDHSHEYLRFAAEAGGLTCVPSLLILTRGGVALADFRPDYLLDLRARDMRAADGGGTAGVTTASALPIALSADRSVEMAILSRLLRVRLRPSRSRVRIESHRFLP